MLILLILFSASILAAVGSAKSCDCADAPVKTRISGGRTARRHAYPYMVQIYIITQRSGSEFKYLTCAGSLIRSNLVLTAAHCVEHLAKYPDKINDITVYPGRHKRPEMFEQPYYKVAFSLIHHDYKGVDIDSHPDLAILVLSQSIPYNDKVKPICLPDSRFVKYSRAIQTGWGRINSNQDSTVLKEVMLYPGDEKNCADQLRSPIDRSLDARRFKEIICMPSRGLDTTCQGDSGGPLVIEENGKYVQIGVVTGGSHTQCGKPGMFMLHMRISAFMDLIQSAINQFGSDC